jgi:hypothetical protein
MNKLLIGLALGAAAESLVVYASMSGIIPYVVTAQEELWSGLGALAIAALLFIKRQ